MMYVYKHKKMMASVRLTGAKMLSDVTQSMRYAVFIGGEIPLHYSVNTI